MKVKIVSFTEPTAIPGHRPSSVSQLRDVEVGFTAHGVTIPVGEDDEALIPWNRVKVVVRSRSVKKPE